MAAPSEAFLDELAGSLRRPEARYLVPAIVATALGYGVEWAPAVYRHAIRDLPPAPSTSSSSPPNIGEDPVPRRVVLRILKEALTKSSILVGVAKVICTQLELNSVVEEGAKDDAFVRKEYATLSGEEIMRRGDDLLDKVYQDKMQGVWDLLGPGMQDISMYPLTSWHDTLAHRFAEFVSRFLTYGTLLAPLSPLDMQLNEVVILSTLIPARSNREMVWHLRASLRSGISRDEVEELQVAIERVCAECGVPNVGQGMPRVVDIERQKEESD